MMSSPVKKTVVVRWLLALAVIFVGSQPFLTARAIDRVAAGTLPLDTSLDSGSPSLEDTELPDLVFYKPWNWPSAIVFSKEPQTSVMAASFFSDEAIYLDWAMTATYSIYLPSEKIPVYMDLYVDDVLVGSWYTYTSKLRRYSVAVRDFEIGPLDPGAHPFRIVLDSTNVVTERDEGNNVFEGFIGVSQGNRAPTVDAGEDFSVRPGEEVLLSGTVVDADGDPFAVKWTQTSGYFLVDLVDADQLEASFMAPDATGATTLTFRLTAHDGLTTGKDQVQVTIDPNYNAKPEVSAGPDQQVLAGAVVTLDGTASDPDGDTVALTWIQVAGTTDAPEVVLADPEVAVTEFVPPDWVRDYRVDLRLVARDAPGAEAFDEVSIFVDSPDPNQVFIPYSLDPTAGVATAGAKPSAYLDDTFIGAVLANPSDVAEPRTDVTARDDAGAEVTAERRTIEAQAQSAFLTSEFTQSSGTAAIWARGWDVPVQGFFLAGDLALRRLDGIGGASQSGTSLFLLNADLGAQRSIVVNLFNDGSTPADEVTLTLRDGTGQSKGSTQVQLEAHGTFRGVLGDLFPEVTELSGGYLEVDSDVAVGGFELVADAETFSALPAQIVRPVSRLTAPHFIVASNGTTAVRLLNRESSARDVEVVVYDNAGTELVRRQETLGAESLTVLDLATVLGSDPGSSETLTGYFEIRLAESGQVVGAIAFRGAEYASSLPLIAEGMKEVDFLHVAQSSAVNLFTGLAVLNSGTVAARITVTVFTEAGEQSGEVEFELAPGQRLVDLLNGTGLLGPEFEQVGGHIRVRSTEPVYAFALFGDTGLHYLSAIEGQAPLLKAGVLRVNRSQCGSNQGPEVVSVLPDPLRGEYTVGAGRTATVRVMFRDQSEAASGLDSVKTGIDLIGWGLFDLYDLEIEPNTTQISTEDPTEREALVSFVVPEGVDRPVTVTVTATDVLGCSTQVDFSVFLG